MTSLKIMSWISTITIILSFILINNVSEAKHQMRNLPSAVVVGTVYCDTRFHQDFPKSSHFISGALVAVECSDTRASTPGFREEVKTDEKGEFRVRLPFSVSKHVKKIKKCSVKLISSSEPYCGIASSATSSTLRLKLKKPGAHIFSAGFFTFKPLKQPELCNQKPSIKNSKEFNALESEVRSPNDHLFPPSLQDPPMPLLPPVDQGILPPLPNLPTVPPLPRVPPIPLPPLVPEKESLNSDELSNQKTFGIPFPPNPFTPPSLLPPNPLQPPPSLFPPNPFQPPSSLFPPIFPSPPPSLFPPLTFPPIPGLIPSPSPPPPVLPIPLIPPFPFQPAPGFPGIPPASSSPSKKSLP